MTVATVCRHHWMIEEQKEGRRVPGKCKHCGVEREFDAVPPEKDLAWREHEVKVIEHGGLTSLL